MRQFVGFVGYYRRFIQNFAELSEPHVALTRKVAVFSWTPERQEVFVKLKSCLFQAPILGFPAEDDRFVLNTDASLFAVGGILNQLQGDREVVIAYASRNIRLSQRRYCTTRREMLAAVMSTHFRSYLRAAQFTLRTDHCSLRWLQKFRNSDGIIARWYMLFGQFSVTFEYRSGAQHANADGLSRQCGQCLRLDCPVSSQDVTARETRSMSEMVDQPFASDLLPELSGKTCVAATYLDEVIGDLPPSGSETDLVTASRMHKTLMTVREWVRTGLPPPWSDCSGLSPELHSWHLQFGNLSID